MNDLAVCVILVLACLAVGAVVWLYIPAWITWTYLLAWGALGWRLWRIR